MQTINKQCCPTCGQSVNRRVIRLTSSLVQCLQEIYKWSVINGRHEFSRKEIAHLLHGETQVANFGNWVHFGGIFYKRGGRGHWGLNTQRAKDFLDGNLQITTAVSHDPLENAYEALEQGYISDIKGISAYCNSAGEFVVEYL